MLASICLAPRSTALDVDGDGLHDDIYKWFYQGLEGMDHDPWTIQQEYWFGWSPLHDDTGGILSLEVAADAQGKSIVAHLESVFGIDYRLRTSSDLSTWTTIGTMTGDGSLLSIQTDADLNVEKARFWRVDGLGPSGVVTATADTLLPFEKHLLGLSLTETDSDSDGMSDAFEVKNRIELSQSSDPEKQASAGRYDPLNGDTNNDGILDGENDYDGDGLINRLELELGTDVELRDSDGDGVEDLHDGWPMHPELAPPRLPEVQYALIEIGEGEFLDFNEEGQVLIKQSDGEEDTFFVWSRGSLISLPVPADMEAIVTVALNDLGQVCGFGQKSVETTPGEHLPYPFGSHQPSSNPVEISVPRALLWTINDTSAAVAEIDGLDVPDNGLSSASLSMSIITNSSRIYGRYLKYGFETYNPRREIDESNYLGSYFAIGESAFTGGRGYWQGTSFTVDDPDQVSQIGSVELGEGEFNWSINWVEQSNPPLQGYSDYEMVPITHNEPEEWRFESYHYDRHDHQFGLHEAQQYEAVSWEDQLSNHYYEEIRDLEGVWEEPGDQIGHILFDGYIETTQRLLVVTEQSDSYFQGNLIVQGAQYEFDIETDPGGAVAPISKLNPESTIYAGRGKVESANSQSGEWSALGGYAWRTQEPQSLSAALWVGQDGAYGGGAVIPFDENGEPASGSIYELTNRLEGLATGGLLRNGRIMVIAQYCQALNAAEGSPAEWQGFAPRAINSLGMIAGTATETATNESKVVVLMPIDIDTDDPALSKNDDPWIFPWEWGTRSFDINASPDTEITGKSFTSTEITYVSSQQEAEDAENKAYKVALTIFHNSVRDANGDVQDFDIHLRVGDGTMNGVSWTKIAFIKTPGSGTPPEPPNLQNDDTADATLSNLTQGGVYQYDLNAFGERTGVQIWLPVAGPDISSYWQGEINYFKNTWGPAYQSKLNFRSSVFLTMGVAGYLAMREAIKTKDMADLGPDLDWLNENASGDTIQGDATPCGLANIFPVNFSGGDRDRFTIHGVVVDFAKRNNMMYALIGREMGISETVLRNGPNTKDKLNQLFGLSNHTGTPDGPAALESYKAGFDLHDGVSLQDVMQNRGIAMQEPDGRSAKEWPSHETTTEGLKRKPEGESKLEALIQ